MPLTDKELIEDYREFVESQMFKNLRVTAEEILPGDPRYNTKYVIKEIDGIRKGKKTNIKVNRVALDAILNDPDLTDKQKSRDCSNF